MAKYEVPFGATSYIARIFISDNSVATGAGLTGLAFDSPGLQWTWAVVGDTTVSTITPVTSTMGVHDDGSFVEMDDILMPGVYEIGIPDTVIDGVTGSLFMMLFGADNMVPCPLEVEIVSEDNRGFSGLKKNRSFSNLPFIMLDESTKLPLAGLTVLVQRLLDGGTFSAGGLTGIADRGNGVYTVNGVSSDTNATYVSFRATATGADPTIFTIITVP